MEILCRVSVYKPVRARKAEQALNLYSIDLLLRGRL